MASEKRCLYEVLGLSLDCTQDQIRSAYKKLALQRHPDKLMQSGLSQGEATAQFQELVHAYEVLSDPKERSWYDSHRSQILFADRNAAASSNSPIPDLFSFFSNTVYSGYSDSGRGFYKVYSDLFSKIYANEINFAKKLGLGLDVVKEAPLMGNLESPYGQVTAFYNYWLGFCTVMDFVWVDEYDAMAGPNRQSRRRMEEENKKLRKKAKREYNETVRGLAEFVKKRDKRVIDMGVKKKEEMERKKKEEIERKRQMEKERLERVRAYEEPEWSRVEEEEEERDDWDEMEEKGNEKKELYCVACGKKFKSDKQWKNHEQSKKHKEKVAELRESFIDEDEEEEEVDSDLEVEEDVEERFREGLGIEEDEDNVENKVDELSEEDEGFFDVKEGGEEADEVDSDNDDEENSVLEGMVSGRNGNKKNASFKSEDVVSETGFHVKDESDEEDFMQYNNRKDRRRGRRAKKERGNKNGAEAMKTDDVKETQSKEEETSVSDLHEQEKQPVENEGSNGVKDDKLGNHEKMSKPVDRKGNKKKETNTKSNASSKGKKAKATTKHSGNVCETCGEEFQSKNKLHKHLGDTGHATLKFR